MRASQCVFNSAIALRKVFISNAAALEAPWHLQRLLLPALTVSCGPSSSASCTSRPFSTSAVPYLRFRRAPVLQDEYPASAGADKYGAAKKGPARDYDIAYPWIQLRQEDGRLSEPQRTTAVLRDMDLTRQTLILLAVPKLDGRSQGPQYPICRIGDRKAEEATQAEVAKKQGPKIVSKKLELNWAIAPNDLRTRMTQLKRFLSKGYQVEVTMAGPKRRGKRLATLDEAKEVLRVVRETVAEVPGAQEMKPMDGQVGDVLTLFLHAPTGKAESSAEKAPTGTQQGT